MEKKKPENLENFQQGKLTKPTRSRCPECAIELLPTSLDVCHVCGWVRLGRVGKGI